MIRKKAFLCFSVISLDNQFSIIFNNAIANTSTRQINTSWKVKNTVRGRKRSFSILAFLWTMKSGTIYSFDAFIVAFEWSVIHTLVLVLRSWDTILFPGIFQVNSLFVINLTDLSEVPFKPFLYIAEVIIY